MIENVKELTQVASPPAPSTADGARRIGGDVVDSAVDATKRVVRKTLDDVSMTPFLRKITFFASGGAFLDGYVLSLIGVALTQIAPAFSLTTEQSALIGASVLVGIFFGTILGGYVTDRIGRRKMFIADVVAIACDSLSTWLYDDEAATLALLYGPVYEDLLI